MNNTLSAKALNKEDNSGAILVSFFAGWNGPIINRTLKAVIRKRIPKKQSCNLIYFYLNAPISKLMGRAVVISVGNVPIADVLKMENLLKLNSEEIISYVGENKEIGLFRLKGIEIAKTPLDLKWLRNHMKFSPPQSFLFISNQAKGLIDKSCNFS